MFEMLSEVVRAEKLLRVITFAELVHRCEMLESTIPVGLREVGELLATVSTGVVRRTRAGLIRRGRGRVKGCLVVREGRAGPRMASQMQGILMSLCFILVFETVVAIQTRVLFLHFMCPESNVSR